MSSAAGNPPTDSFPSEDSRLSFRERHAAATAKLDTGKKLYFSKRDRFWFALTPEQSAEYSKITKETDGDDAEERKATLLAGWKIQEPTRRSTNQPDSMTPDESNTGELEQRR